MHDRVQRLLFVARKSWHRGQPSEQIGLLAEAEGDRTRAVAAFTEALAIDPESAVAQQHLAASSSKRPCQAR
jgi:alkylhydroperoxidase family enzyme